MHAGFFTHRFGLGAAGAARVAHFHTQGGAGDPVGGLLAFGHAGKVGGFGLRRRRRQARLPGACRAWRCWCRWRRPCGLHQPGGLCGGRAPADGRWMTRSRYRSGSRSCRLAAPAPGQPCRARGWCVVSGRCHAGRRVARGQSRVHRQVATRGGRILLDQVGEVGLADPRQRVQRQAQAHGRVAGHQVHALVAQEPGAGGPRRAVRCRHYPRHLDRQHIAHGVSSFCSNTRRRRARSISSSSLELNGSTLTGRRRSRHR